MAHSPLASPTATRAVLERHGLHTRKALGQHFLIDDNIIGRILRLSEIEPGEPLLEVGPGIGTLTVALLECGAEVVAVEYDNRLIPVLEELRATHGRLHIVHADAVDVAPSRLVTPSGPPRALIANLPYGVAATVVLRLFEELPSLERAIVMVQAEVADRMAASPGSKAYGAYTVKLALRASAGQRFAVPRTCFQPPPRVDSAVIRLDRVSRTVSDQLIRAAARAADAAFSQRRKTVRNSLAAGLGVPLVQAQEMLAQAGISPAVRAEEIGIEGFLGLASALVDQRPVQ